MIKSMGINIIACVGPKWELGYQGNLIYNLPQDKKFFHDMTVNSVCIMGRKTFESFPGKQPLVDRFNVVLTKDRNFRADFPNVRVVNTIEQAEGCAKLVSPTYPRGVYVIGGGIIYREMLDRCELAYVTRILNAPAPHCDTFFPDLGNNDSWNLYEQTPIRVWRGAQYSFCVYSRTKKKHLILV